jgi:pSer/pThr/pTyr-binding forkhead associated (FHA) protein
MMSKQAFGRLIPAGAGGESFLLEKGIVEIGRSPECDITLAGARVSRRHARVICSPEACVLRDLNSANGVLVNGRPIDQITLQVGDLIHIGEYTLRFAAAVSSAFVHDMTAIDSLSDLDQTLRLTALDTTLNETVDARLAVHTPQGTWEYTLHEGGARIGRALDNDIVLPLLRVSRYHAVVEEVAGGFFVRDLRSANGTLLNGRAVDRRRLPNGATIQIGEATLIFKQGFQPADLTLHDLTPQQLRRRRPVVVVPGLMGSQLWRGSEQIWPRVQAFFGDPDLFKLDPSGETELEPRGLVNEVVIVPNLLKQAQYGRLGDFLVENLGYTRDKNLLEFAYDWRQDVRRSARRLAAAIESWENRGVRGPVTIIAHSLGTLVSRYYINQLGGDRKVERIMLIGGPHQGTPRALTSLVMGAQLLPFGLKGEQLRDIMRTFHSSYQYLPFYPCVVDTAGGRRVIDLMTEDEWLPEQYRQLLGYGRDFRRQVGMRLKVPAVSIFGYGQRTLTGVQVVRDIQRAWRKVDLIYDNKGDLMVPEESAILPGTDIHPVQQAHGSLYVDNDVQMRLKIELMR